ncbi:Decaprenyl-phosphate phosphoribosyltransferase [Pseudovibrio axinellae]|uniref:Decaprenyl-phosphate phosphoribosyltransferase n=1 Tax=Pseudovibrio axinellae TaxID=989403 RepID=A0A165ZGZ7_9HYPH|nr:UbiA family prenyltransferase [Pseudovibrio axinellae]KZL19888.1 Decaprenyl-phosphate phosphoribosyltransferase [Pseudovibrio axinellae]SER38131.1 4-hydroxybenzoate polyprenyltransferase [Pseudovibrio axinellae]
MEDQQEVYSSADTDLQIPLVLDVDYTLIRTDCFYEALVLFIKANPLNLLIVFYWLLKGRAYVKQQLAVHVDLKIDHLPLNESVVAYARSEAAKGRKVHMATAADEILAIAIAKRLGFVEEILASDGKINLKAENKAALLKQKFPDGFAYAGDSISDLPVFRSAVQSLIVHPSNSFWQKAAKCGVIEKTFIRPDGFWRPFLKSLRLHQWAKNTLVFVPMILGGQALNASAWASALLGFIALGVLASSTYLLNDLWDLEADRQHWSKKNRPLASGKLKIVHALLAIPIGLALSFTIAAFLGVAVVIGCFVYLVTTVSYSLYFKRLPLLDTAILAALFTMRLGIGVALVGVPPSPWLFVFSMYLFLSLSMAKRHTELARHIETGTRHELSGRGYRNIDLPVLLALGTASGLAATLVMVLYLTNEAFNAAFYSAPALLWGMPPVLFLWLGRVWLKCQRLELNDDPVVFALKDKQSLVLGGVLTLLFLSASFGGYLI